jgi:hypothetical protein
MANETNYHIETTAKFKGLSNAETQEIVKAYLVWRKKRNKPEFIEANGKQLQVSFESQSKSAYWKSRSNSFYFIYDNQLIRISDHWSHTGDAFPKSNKLNCGQIASCYWTCENAQETNMFLPGEKYVSRLVGGIVNLNEMN